MAKRGRPALPVGVKRKQVFFSLNSEEMEMLDGVAAHLKMDRSEFIRSAVLYRVSAAVDAWGEEAAQKSITARARAKWMAECADPNGAVQRALGSKS